MALHLVTGYKGTPHITAADQGALNAGFVGAGEYVLNSGNKFSASVISNNIIKILDGDAVIQGRHVNLKKDTYEEITINNGETGKNRNDLIVLRYTKDTQTGVESAEFAVIQGTAIEGTATDPEYTTGDIFSDACVLHEMPLYRITLNGLTVGTPEVMFKVTEDLETLQSEVDKKFEKLQGVTNKGEITITSSEDTVAYWRELGEGVYIIPDCYSLFPSAVTSTPPFNGKGTLFNVNEDGFINQILFNNGNLFIRAAYSKTKWGNAGNEPHSGWMQVSTTHGSNTQFYTYTGTGLYGGINNERATIIPIGKVEKLNAEPKCVIIHYYYSTFVWMKGMDWSGWIDESGNLHSVSAGISAQTTKINGLTDTYWNFWMYSTQSSTSQFNYVGYEYQVMVIA